MEKILIDKHYKNKTYNINSLSKNTNPKFTYDKQGYIKRYKDYIFKWDNLGRLIKCFKVQKDKSKIIASFEYDDDGFRTKKITPQAITDYCLFYQRINRPKSTKAYQYSTNSLRNATKNAVFCTNCTMEIEYLHSTLHLTGFVIKQGNIKTNYTFRLNYLNDVVGIYNSDNIEIVRYNYKPNGEHAINVRVGKFFVDEYNDKLRNNTEFITNLGIAKLNTYRAKSRLYDQETGLYYFNDNYYCPRLNAFLKPSEINF